MIERTVPLADHEYRELQEAFDWVHALNDQLVALISSLAEARARNQRAAWETVNRLVDRKDGEHITIDWVNRCLVAKQDERLSGGKWRHS